MTVVTIIPARYGSLRLLGKPLADIADKLTIQHVYDCASIVLNKAGGFGAFVVVVYLILKGRSYIYSAAESFSTVMSGAAQ